MALFALTRELNILSKMQIDQKSLQQMQSVNYINADMKAIKFRAFEWHFQISRWQLLLPFLTAFALL